MSHAKLSPSAAKRWINCPASVEFSLQFPQKSSSYADEGTAAHKLAEFCTKKNLNPVQFIGNKIKGTEYSVSEDMAEAVNVYRETIEGILTLHGMESVPPIVEFEKRLSLEHISKGMFGTSDCIIKTPKILYVMDYKHGAGVAVDAEENEQAMLYGLGADPTFSYEKIVLGIIQPRANHPEGPVRIWSTTPERMKEFSAFVTKAAEVTRSKEAPFKSGSHCRFCPASGACPKQKDQALEAAQAHFAENTFKPIPAEKLSDSELKMILSNEDLILQWVKSVRDYAENKLLNGEKIEGFKLVQSLGHRKWKDENKLSEIMENYPVNIHEQKLKSPAVIEKEVKAAIEDKKERKNVLALLETLTVRPLGGPTLAPISDKRLEYKKAEDYFSSKSFLE